jgi:hypothetical protein
MPNLRGLCCIQPSVKHASGSHVQSLHGQASSDLIAGNRCNRPLTSPLGYFFDTKNRFAQYRHPSSRTAKNPR